jgi:hypothetical protein
MKCRDFGSVLKTFADMLDVAGAPIARDRITMFVAAFDADPTSSVSDFAKRMALLGKAGGSSSPNLSDVDRLLSGLKGVLNKTAKTTVLTDVNTIEKLLRDRPSMEIDAFVRMAVEASANRRPSRARGATAVRDDLVVDYKQKLEASLGDEDKFATVYDDLCANTAVGKAEVVALAKQMTGGSARTRDAALKKIWNRHASQLVFKAKSRATGGRSAA